MEASLCEATLDLDDAMILGDIRARDAMGKGGRIEVIRNRSR